MRLTLVILFLASICSAQNTPAKITLLDGSSFEGYAKIARNRILFRMSLEDKPDKWGPKEVWRIEFDGGGLISTYQYERRQPKGMFLLLKVLEEGDMTLYQENNAVELGGGISSDGSGFIGAGRTGIKLYIKKKNTEALFQLDGMKKSKKKVLMDCFSDCPDLLKRIESKKYRELNLRDLVWEYNEYCSE